MSRIEEMLKELCPDGVEYRRLGNCCKIETGRLNANAAVEDGEYPFFTTAQEVSHIDSYRWDTEALLIAGNANVGDVKYYKGKFEAYQRTYVLTSFSQRLLPKFLFYVLKSQLKPYLEDHKHEAAMTYIVLSSLQNFEIPIPPLQVQEEIVQILDTFTKLTTELAAELAAELAMRTKQYAYYRDELLTGELMPDNVQYMSIGELIQFSSLRQKHISSQAPVYSVSNRLGLLPLSEYRMEGTSAHASKDTSEYYVVRKDWFAYNPARIDIGTLGKMTDEIGLVSPAYKVFTVKDENVILPDYLALLFKTSLVMAGINRYVEVGARVRMDVDRWNRIYVPVPDIETQKRAVAFLHDLESVCTDLTSGLPAEIEARNKQYAYYRDMMLDFPHLQS